MAKSKRDMMYELIRKEIETAIREVAFNAPDYTQALRACCDSLAYKAASRITYDDYRWLEVQDIMAWRKRRVAD